MAQQQTIMIGNAGQYGKRPNNVVKSALVLVVLAGSLAAESHYDKYTHTIEYSVKVSSEEPDLFRVAIHVPVTDMDTLLFRMPRWSPGAYALRDYAGRVLTMTAQDENGVRLSVTRRDINGWQVIPGAGAACISYAIRPTLESWTGSRFDSTYVLIEGPSTFMFLQGRRKMPVVVDYQIPETWDIISALDSSGSKYRYFAANYDIFVDSPTQLGVFEVYETPVAGANVLCVFHGKSDFSREQFMGMVNRICSYQVQLFSERPFERYVFFYKILAGRTGGGGLEHSNASTIGISADRLRSSVLSAAEVTAHEFFHLWNVKRIYPAVFSEIDYNGPQRSYDLWFCEGVTSYYEALTLVRCGLWDKGRFYEEMADQIEWLQETDGRKKLSIAQASWSTWERGHQSPQLSYYNKGELLGLLLDLKIRNVTANAAGLDDLMRYLNRQYAHRGRGFDADGLQTAIARLTGHDFSDFFRDYVFGTDELPYQDHLDFAGLHLDYQTYDSPSIGEVIFIEPNNRVVSVEKNSPAARAGLQKNDYVRALNGIEITSLSQFCEMIHTLGAGAEIKLNVVRQREVAQIPVKITTKHDVECRISEDKTSRTLQQQIRLGILEGRTN